MNISISESANKNYLAKIISLEKLVKHPNADRLQMAVVDFQNVITGMDAKKWDIYVFFPLESCIDPGFLAWSNSYRDKDLNSDKEKVGFFDKKGRVRAVKLRGQKSMGYIVPLKELEEYFCISISDVEINTEFDTIGDTCVVKKYIVPSRAQNPAKQGKKPRISRLVDGQVRLHVDTENLRKNAGMIKPDDNISISYKLHGTSFWVANVPVKKKLSLWQRILMILGGDMVDTEYDYVYGSRRVVKNEYETQDTMDFYDSDLWGGIKDEMSYFIPKNYTFYGECVGYTKEGAAIQSKYDYGCTQGERKMYIYRITFTNADGIVHNLSAEEMKEMGDRLGFLTVPLFYSGKAKNWNKRITITKDWAKKFIRSLEKKYNDKTCYLCKNVVPEEGVVVRNEKGPDFEAYKLKSFAFLEHETKMLDKGVEDIEQ